MKAPTIWLARAALAAAATAVMCCGAPSGPQALTVSGAWARPTPPTAHDAVVYLQIVSPTDDRLIGVSVAPETAARAELHETMTGNGGETGQMGEMAGMDDSRATAELTMRPLDAVDLKARRRVQFKPGGRHIMLRDLAAPLQRGRHLALTLCFVGAGSVDVDVAVQDNPS